MLAGLGPCDWAHHFIPVPSCLQSFVLEKCHRNPARLVEVSTLRDDHRHLAVVGDL